EHRPDPCVAPERQVCSARPLNYQPLLTTGWAGCCGGRGARANRQSFASSGGPPAMRATDQMLTDYVSEIEEKQQLIDTLVESAQKEGRDLDPKELELAERARDRINVCNKNMIPLEESRKISIDSAERIAEIAKHMAAVDKEKPAEVEYRSAGAYVLDYWKASLGAGDAHQRLDTYNRAASHQTTADNPGLLPTPVVQPVINFID